MSNLRRILRTTAAAAGIAALGAGFAGTAFAAPAEPVVPVAPGTDALGSAPGLTSFLPAPQVVPEVPAAFAFDPLNLHPAVPTTSANTGARDNSGDLGSPSVDPSSATPRNDVASPAADTPDGAASAPQDGTAR